VRGYPSDAGNGRGFGRVEGGGGCLSCFAEAVKGGGEGTCSRCADVDVLVNLVNGRAAGAEDKIPLPPPYADVAVETPISARY
jgi:hypothetical protein